MLGAIWYNVDTGKLSIRCSTMYGITEVIPYSPQPYKYCGM